MIRLTDAAREALTRALEIEDGGTDHRDGAAPAGPSVPPMPGGARATDAPARRARARWARIVVDDYS